MDYVSFRLDPVTKDLLRKRVEADRISLQSFMTNLVTDALTRGRDAPILSNVIQALRSRREALAADHLTHLWVFGSVARGEDRYDSDVDLIAQFQEGSKVSLTTVSRIRLDLVDLLSRNVDLAEWRTLRPEIETEARRDAVQVF